MNELKIVKCIQYYNINNHYYCYCNDSNIYINNNHHKKIDDGNYSNSNNSYDNNKVDHNGDDDKVNKCTAILSS